MRLLSFLQSLGSHRKHEHVRPSLVADEPKVDVHVIDNRVFLLGLDKLYRKAMKSKERGELLSCARRVASAIHVTPANEPVEGYYAEDAQLTEYFLLMRALQSTRKADGISVESLDEFRRLKQVVSSPLFGVPEDSDKLLPRSEDSLTKALSDLYPHWSIAGIVDAAHARSSHADDISLVGLAALARDALVLAAVRESVVLHAAVFFGSALSPPEPQFIWEVDEELTARGKRFVDAFNGLFGALLPIPGPSGAEEYWHACVNNVIVGRCVRIGADDSAQPVRHYHWGIRRDPSGKPAVEDFWKDEIWTTTRYRAMLFPNTKEFPEFLRRGDD